MIQFAHPWALLSLISLPVIYYLYQLRPAREEIRISSISFWQAALKARERGRRLQKALRDINLILLLMLALALSVGLAGPQWPIRSNQSGDTVLIVDVSASMQAHATNSVIASGPLARTRFAAAKREALNLINRLGDGDRMLIMSSGRHARMLSAFESDQAALRRTIEALAPTDEAGRPADALVLAQSLLREREQGRIFFVTDGAFSAPFDRPGPATEFRLVGQAADNVAVTQFEFRRAIGHADRFEVLLTVHNYTEAAVNPPVRITMNRKTLVERNLTIPAKDDKTLVIPLRGKMRGRAEVVVDLEDNLAVDNRAYAAFSTLEPRNVLLVSSGNFYLETALRALPNLRLEVVPASSTLPANLGKLYDIVVFDGLAPPVLTQGSYLVINASVTNLPFTVTGTIGDSAVAGKSESALVKDLDLSGVKIQQSARIAYTPEAGVQNLFWSNDSALAMTVLNKALRVVYLGFDLSRSNFPLQAAFPLFIGRTVSWLAPTSAYDSGHQILAGDTTTLQLPAGAAEVMIASPSGEADIFPIASSVYAYTDTAKIGIYRYRAGDIDRHFAVNLNDAAESDITPRQQLANARQPPLVPTQGANVALALWPYFAWFALALVLIEWCVWCMRRSHA